MKFFAFNNEIVDDKTFEILKNIEKKSDKTKIYTSICILVVAIACIIFFAFIKDWFLVSCLTMLCFFTIIFLVLYRVNKKNLANYWYAYSSLFMYLYILYVFGLNGGTVFVILGSAIFNFIYLNNLKELALYMMISLIGILIVIYIPNNSPVTGQNEINIYRISALFVSYSILFFTVNFIKGREKDYILQTDALINTLNRKNADLENFTYAISHDFREPLKSIEGFTNLIAKGIKKKDYNNFERFSNYLQAATKQMDSVLTTSYKYALANYEDLEKSEVNLNQVLEQVKIGLKLLITEKKAKIESHKLPILFSNSYLWTQIFQNLIHNAIKFTDPNKLPLVKIVYKAVPKVVISIVDNGIGVEEKYHQQIFNMFKRLHTKEAYHGSGLGLSFVKKTILDMGGSISIDKNYTNGAKFDLTIPKDLLFNNEDNKFNIVSKIK